MKKIIIILLSLFIISGCSQTVSSDAKISQEKEEILYKYDGKNYTNNDTFQRLKAQQVGTYFDYLVANKALELEGISEEDYTNEVELQYQAMINMYGEEMVNSYFGDKESYISQALQDDLSKLSLTYTIYQRKYILDNIDNFIADYPTVKVEYITSSNEAKINTFLKNLKKDKTKDFDKAFEKAKFEEAEIVTNTIIEIANTSLPTEVLDAFETLESGNTSDLITIENTDDSGNTTKTYFVVKMVGKDVKTEYLNDFTDYILNNGYVPIPTIIAKEKHELVMYDDDFNNTYETILAQYSTESDAQ